MKTKKIMSLLLTLCMLLSAVPMMTFTASATTTVSWTVNYSDDSSKEGYNVYVFDKDITDIKSESQLSGAALSSGTVAGVGKYPNILYKATGSIEGDLSDGDTVYCVIVNEYNYAKTSAEISDSSVTFNTSGLDFSDFNTWGNDYDTATEFTINNIDELKKFGRMVNSGKNFDGKTVKLGDSFDNTSEPMTTPIGTASDTASGNCFSGTFDGNGKTVTLDINSKSSYIGFFGACCNATIKNLTVTGTVTGNVCVGGICGILMIPIANGTEYLNIINCTNNADISGYDCVGGICGVIPNQSIGKIESCTNNGKITGTYSEEYENYGYLIGGICGMNGSSIYGADVTDCVNNGKVTNVIYENYTTDENKIMAYNYNEGDSYADITGYANNQWHQVTINNYGIEISSYENKVDVSLNTPEIVNDGKLIKLTMTATNNSSDTVDDIVYFLADTAFSGTDISTNTVENNVLKMSEYGSTLFAFSDDERFNVVCNILYNILDNDPRELECLSEKCDSSFIAYYTDGDNEITFNAGETKEFIIYIGIAADDDVDDIIKDISGEIPEVIKDAKYTASLTLKDNIDVNFKIKNIPSAEEAKLEVYLNNSDTPTEFTLTDGETSAMSVSVAPENMSEDIHIKVVYDGVTVKEFDFSVADYCNAVFNNKNYGVNSKLGQLCKAVLNYGKYAEDYKNGNTESTLNNGYEITEWDNIETVEGSGSTATNAAASLTLNSTISLNFYVTDTVTEDQITIFNNNNEQVEAKCIKVESIDKDGYKTKITISNIYAEQMSRAYTLKVDGEALITYGVYNYCKDVIDHTTDTTYTAALQTLCKAIYNYGVKAADFAG